MNSSLFVLHSSLNFTLHLTHELLHALILVLLEDSSNLGDEPFVDGNTQNSKNYTDDAPYHLTEIRIYSNHAAQWQQKRNSIKIDL